MNVDELKDVIHCNLSSGTSQIKSENMSEENSEHNTYLRAYKIEESLVGRIEMKPKRHIPNVQSKEVIKKPQTTL